MDLQKRVEQLEKENQDLIKANQRLQKRLKDSQDIIVERDVRIQELLLLNKSLKESKGKNTIVFKDRKEPKVLSQEKKDKRARAIYGILKNKTKYKLFEQEIGFLRDIQYKENLTTKQYEWFKKIQGRGRQIGNY